MPDPWCSAVGGRESCFTASAPTSAYKPRGWGWVGSVTVLVSAGSRIRGWFHTPWMCS
jgi:hypothetical protein